MTSCVSLISWHNQDPFFKNWHHGIRCMINWSVVTVILVQIKNKSRSLVIYFKTKVFLNYITMRYFTSQYLTFSCFRQSVKLYKKHVYNYFQINISWLIAFNVQTTLTFLFFAVNVEKHHTPRARVHVCLYPCVSGTIAANRCPVVRYFSVSYIRTRTYEALSALICTLIRHEAQVFA